MNPWLLTGSDVWLCAAWTMLHYLWVGTLLGSLALACKWALSTAGAGTRYLVAVSWLAVLAVAPVGIAVSVGSLEGPEISSAPLDDHPAERTVSQPGKPLPDRSSGAPEGSTAELGASRRMAESASSGTVSFSGEGFLPGGSSKWANAIAYLPWLWLVGSPLVFAWSMTGLAGAERLRKLSEPVSDPRVEELCRRLARSLRITRGIAVRVCRRVSSPILVGVLRPAILLPPALISGLSPEQLEMILLHELAHVRRWDNLVNLLQRIVESLLFFHPAVWLVSRWVRQEREHCCDDVVLGRVADRDRYAETLLRIVGADRSARTVERSLIVQAAESVSAAARSHLGVRIRHILCRKEEKMRVSPKLVVAISVALLLAAGAASSLGLTPQTEAPSAGVEVSELGTGEDGRETVDVVRPSPNRLKVSAESLVRAVIEQENRIHEVDGILVRTEWKSIPTPKDIAQTRAELRKKFPGTEITAERFSDLRPKPYMTVELAFDRSRVRYCRTTEDKGIDLRIWDGKQTCRYGRQLTTGREGCTLDRQTGGHFFPLPYALSWLKVGAHSFWWNSDDVKVGGIVFWFGRKDSLVHTEPMDGPEDFVLRGRDRFRGEECYAVESWRGHRRLLIGVADRRLRGMIRFSRPSSADRNKIMSRIAGKPIEGQDQWETWLKEKVSGEREEAETRYVHELFDASKRRIEHFLADYREVSPGLWVPMSFGHTWFGLDDDEGQPYEKSRLEARIVEIRVNPSLPDDLFAFEIDDDVNVSDLRYDPPLSYKYKQDFSDEQWQAILQENAKRNALLRKVQAKQDAPIGKPASAFP